jgi:hypothetical protein
MAMTFKRRRDGEERAAFAAYFSLNREQVATIERLAEEDGLSCRKWLKEVAIRAIERRANITIRDRSRNQVSDAN